MERETVIEVEGLGKVFRLGMFGGKTLRTDILNWMRGIKKRLSGESRVENDYFHALRDINFSVKQGEILGIIGKNGAGKSTLLKLLSQITIPTEGEIRIKGRIASLLEVGTGFHPELTGRENIFLNGAILGMTKAEVQKKLDQIIEFAGIPAHIDTPVKRYSSGMKVRLGFAVAAHLEPEILVIDEVLAVGDDEFQRKCLGKMKEVSGSGRTVLFVSHNMSAVRNLCTRAVLLQDGKLTASGDPGEVISKYLQAGLNDDNGNAVVFTPDPTKKIQILSVELHPETGLNGFEYSEEIKASVKLAVRSELTSPYLFVYLEDNYGNWIMASGSNDYDADPISELTPGEHSFNITFPSSFLKPGMYYLTVSFRDRDFNDVVEKKERILKIDVIDTITRRGQKNLYRAPALVAPPIRFEKAPVKKEVFK